jgi:hypothetical protein
MRSETDVLSKKTPALRTKMRERVAEAKDYKSGNWWGWSFTSYPCKSEGWGNQAIVAKDNRARAKTNAGILRCAQDDTLGV